MKTRGGGVMFIVDNTLRSKTIFELSNFFELLVIEITFKNLKFIIGIVYFASPNKKEYEKLFQHIDHFLQIYNQHIVLIIGDFNLAGYTWDYSTDTPSVIGYHNNNVIRDSIQQL